MNKEKNIESIITIGTYVECMHKNRILTSVSLQKIAKLLFKLLKSFLKYIYVCLNRTQFRLKYILKVFQLLILYNYIYIGSYLTSIYILSLAHANSEYIYHKLFFDRRKIQF